MTLTFEDKKWLVKLAMVTVVTLARVMGIKCSKRSISSDFRAMFAVMDSEKLESLE
jgi:hypothetical protein